MSVLPFVLTFSTWLIVGVLARPVFDRADGAEWALWALLAFGCSGPIAALFVS